MKIVQLTNKTPYQTMGYALQSKTGEVLVIDGGMTGNDSELYRIIKKLGGSVGLWLITHPHNDHFDAVIEVLTKYKDVNYKKIGSSMLPDAWAEDLDEEEKKELHTWNAFAKTLDDRHFEIKEGMQFSLGNMKVEVLTENNPDLKVNAFNNQSCVFKVSEDDFSILFLGDLGVEGGNRLLSKSYDLKCTAVQMAHHGQGGVTEEVYKAIHPKYAFWPTPGWLWENRKYLGEGKIGEGPFKTQKTAEWMKSLGAKNIFSFDHTTMFDTYTLTATEF